MEGSVAGKWLELLKEIAPRVTRVAFLTLLLHRMSRFLADTVAKRFLASERRTFFSD
jgi:hypothetical protein